MLFGREYRGVGRLVGGLSLFGGERFMEGRWTRRVDGLVFFGRDHLVVGRLSLFGRMAVFGRTVFGRTAI